jgi:hypothetical protein
MIFHRHDFIEQGYKIYHRHLTEEKNWAKYGKDICPYPECTKKLKVFMCKCGEEKELEVNYDTKN